MLTVKRNNSERGMKVKEELSGFTDSDSWLVAKPNDKVTSLEMSDRREILVNSQMLLHSPMAVRGPETLSSKPIRLPVSFLCGAQDEHTKMCQ